MKRQDIETYMKKISIDQIDLIYNQDDKLGVYCSLKNGKLYDYTNHVVDRKRDIWGCLTWQNGESSRISFDQLIKED